MKKIIIVVMVCCCAAAAAQSKNPLYDAKLAEKLGADEYGMRKYVMAFLKTGPVTVKDSVARRDLLMAHLKNITRLANEGKLAVAGPFMDDSDIRGIYIFMVESVDDARMLTATDPAIKAGTLVMELHPWYASAAITETFSTHKKIEKVSFSD